MNELITQTEAAELRGVSLRSINNLVRRGRLRSVEQFGKKLLYRNEVESFEPEKGGRPPAQKVEATNGQATLKRAATKGEKKPSPQSADKGIIRGLSDSQESREAKATAKKATKK
jgi:hypothetical protein